MNESLAESLNLSYAESQKTQHYRQSIIGMIIAIILLPTGFILDWAVYPEVRAQLATYRIGCEIGLIIILLIHLIPKSINYTKILSFSWALVIEVSICLMIMSAGDPSGPYYAGLNLVVLGLIVVLPLSFFESIVLASITVLAYGLTIFISDEIALSTSRVINNLYFLISTCFIGCCASYFAEKRRFREFKLNYELDLRTKELSQLDRAKSDFYANISHEFRTPLTLILAPVEDLLSKPNINQQIKKDLGYIKQNCYRLLKLVNDLLDIQKLEERKEFLEYQPIELNSFLNNICSGMEALANRKSILLTYQSGDQDVVVKGDHSALEKIFINLINNAIKFTSSDGSITVKLSKSQFHCRIEVIDTGSGIGDDDLPFIFDRFRQVDSSVTRKHQGTGLGLALVKELSQMHGGSVSVLSQLGVGTTMTISLPLSDQSKTPDLEYETGVIDDVQILHKNADIHLTLDENSLGEKDSFENKPDSSDASKKILDVSASGDIADARPKLLIVEDEPGIRDYLSRTLDQEYEVSTASDGLDGLKKIRTDKPQLVILDLMLPLIDGLSVCEQVKTDEDVWTTKILLLTARTDEKSKLDALQKGADDFLTKPFSTVEIKSRLANMWNTSQLQRDVERSNAELRQTMSELKSTQSNLIQSEKLNALGRLAAGLLHEVNNPLSFAFATFQMLEREPDLAENEYAQDLMKDIRIGMERIAAIVKDLKTFAYPEATDLEANFQLKAAIESALRFTASRTSRVTIHNLVKDEALVGSQSHIVQVMVNLLENASDAMQSMTDTPPEIIIESTRLDSGRIQVSFTDNGPGIPDDVKKHIFDPFYTTKDVGSGMGMGLSICHTIIENHKGVLAVESEVGSFTKFTFDLDNALNMLSKFNESHKDL